MRGECVKLLEGIMENCPEVRSETTPDPWFFIDDLQVEHSMATAIHIPSLLKTFSVSLWQLVGANLLSNCFFARTNLRSSHSQREPITTTYDHTHTHCQPHSLRPFTFCSVGSFIPYLQTGYQMLRRCLNKGTSQPSPLEDLSQSDG